MAVMYKVGHATSNDYIPLIAGETLSIRQAVYVASDSKVYVAQGPMTTGAVGFAMTAANAGETVLVKTTGHIGGFTGLVPRQFYGPAANGTVAIESPFRSMARAITTSVLLILQGPYRMAVLWDDVVDHPIYESYAVTLDSSMVSLKEFPLPYKIASEPSGVILLVENGPVLTYSTDYTVVDSTSGSKISWDGLALESQAIVGLTMRAIYWRVFVG